MLPLHLHKYYIIEKKRFRAVKETGYRSKAFKAARYFSPHYAKCFSSTFFCGSGKSIFHHEWFIWKEATWITSQYNKSKWIVCNILLSLIMPRAELPRYTVVVLSVRPSVTSISRRSLKTKRWNKQYKLISMFARIWIGRTFVRRLVRELWRDLLTLQPWLAIWTSLQTKLPTRDCLAACRFDLYYR